MLSSVGGSQLDTFYRRLVLTGFFTKGWGKPEHMKKIFSLRRRMANRENALRYVDPEHPVELEEEVEYKDHRRIKGSFESPCVKYLDEELLLDTVIQSSSVAVVITNLRDVIVFSNRVARTLLGVTEARVT